MGSEPRRSTAVPGPREAAERCSHCLQTYVVEIGAWCVRCDDAVCPFCLVDVAGEARCPACREEG